MTTQQAQILTDRTSLISADTPMPELLPGPNGQMVAMYAGTQQTSKQVFAAALDQVMTITAVLTLVGVALAFMLPAPGPAKTGSDAGSAASAALAAQVTAVLIGFSCVRCPSLTKVRNN